MYPYMAPMPDTRSKLQHLEEALAPFWPSTPCTAQARSRPPGQTQLQMLLYAAVQIRAHCPTAQACTSTKSTCMQERLTTSNPNLEQHAAAHGTSVGLQDPDTPVEDDPYADRRWREIKLQPHGRRFTEKVQQLFSSVDLSAGESLSCSLRAPGGAYCGR